MIETLYTEDNGTYLKNNPTWHIEDSPWKAGQILKMLKRNPIQPKSIAEVGCGAGEILNQLYVSMPKDVSFTGYDISGDAIRLARQREKKRLQFLQDDFVSINERFDLLLMIDVFEHVEDYFGFLKACRKKAEYTIFHIPLDLSINSILRNKLISKRNNVGHLNYFSKETALATLSDTGYKIVDYFYSEPTFNLLGRSMKSKLAFYPRRLMFKINKDIAVKALGGFSLMVLTSSGS